MEIIRITYGGKGTTIVPVRTVEQITPEEKPALPPLDINELFNH